VNAVIQHEEKLSSNGSIFVPQDAQNATGESETD
jgi:hypothetical protein